MDELMKNRTGQINASKRTSPTKNKRNSIGQPQEYYTSDQSSLSFYLFPGNIPLYCCRYCCTGRKQDFVPKFPPNVKTGGEKLCTKKINMGILLASQPLQSHLIWSNKIKIDHAIRSKIQRFINKMHFGKQTK